jgi:mRNA interferase RelE/StbE
MAFYRIEIARSAAKDLRGIDRKWIPRMVTTIEGLITDPRPSGCKKLMGSDHTYRLRIGTYRVIYDIHDDTLIVLVVRIRYRRDAYR